MANKKTNLIKLGLFTVSGIAFLVLTLYFIGRNKQLFRSSIQVNAYFRNAGGVVPGNNVRYAGIHAGTVKSVKLINDTIIEFQLLLDKKTAAHILNNSIASIGTEGVIGNKVVNILPGSGTGNPIQDGDRLQAKRTTDTEAMLETLSETNQNALLLSNELVKTITRINNSSTLWRILEDSSLSDAIKSSLLNIQKASANTQDLTGELGEFIHELKQGDGLANKLVYDTTISRQLSITMEQLENTSRQTEELTTRVNEILQHVQVEIKQGKGPANAVLSDTSMTGSLHRSLNNIEQSTARFNENMEALRHNFLLKGYFRKKEKKERK
ncbi:MlaD family protein [Flavihumibacter sp. UBA7668]|uniref:MlaD family protein n=1 Tax=Flavihumibacter sp. UBA7668 TaxID=1946542 RepID=UPI0025BF8B4D|nr:MlaD family protein [Flavihumibacter sp. UBA7668]